MTMLSRYGKRRTWMSIALLAIVLIVSRAILHRSASAATRKTTEPVAVATAMVARADVPIFLQGLGTVQAFYTVTVTARVDGELQRVAFTEGQRVHKGDLLAQIDPRPNQAAFDQAAATKAKDEAQLANARRDFARYTELQPLDLASKQTFDTQRALVDQLAAQIKVDRAVIDNARTQLDYTRITSPIDGRTGIRLIDPGNIVHAADTTGIVVVTQMQPIAVIFTLPEEDLETVNEALAAGPVAVTTISRDGGEVLDHGTLTLIDNEIQQATGTLKLKATFNNSRNTLWPGQYVNTRVLVRTDHDALTLPSSAVQLGPDGPFTFVVKSDATVEVRPLKLGPQTDAVTVVVAGVALNERVVTSNQYRLQAGTQVKLVSAASAANAVKTAAPGLILMSISEPFVRRPIATSLLMGGLFLVGLVVFPLLPVAPLPQVDFPTIQVSVNLPGASPETMASSVAAPLEYQFAEISGLSQMTSTSILGNSQITLQFDLDRSIDAAAQDVQSRIDAAGGQLPKNLPTPPTYRKVNPADSAILILAVHSDVLPVTTVDDYAENILAQQVSQIPGIAQVVIGGQQKPAVRVQVDPVKVAALGLDLEDIAGVITQATVDAPKGSINGPTRSMTIYDNDQLLKAAPWNDVVVAYKNGAPVRIRDIGVAVDGPENALMRGSQNGHRGILLLIYKQAGANVIDAVSSVQALLPHALISVPPSIKVDTVANRTTTIQASVRDVEFTLALTIALVVMVIFLFLRNAWATIIPGVTVPLALLGTAALMYVLHYSLDNLSLMALTIAVGFVVDDAIVMLENIYRHIEAGLTPLEATLKGAGEIGFTIMSISISLVAVFIPLLLMGGIIGRLFREFAITMTATIAVSAVVALTLSPTMCALFLRDEKHAKHGRAYMAIERAFDKILAGYTRGLDFVLDHQRATLMVFLATVAASIVLYIYIPKGFFPQQDTGIIVGLTDAPQDVSFDEMVRRQDALMAVVARDPGVASYGNFLGGNRPLNNGFVILGLKPRDERSASADEIINRLRPQLAQVPGATLFLQAAQDLNIGGRTARTQYQYTLQDSNIDELNEWSPKLLAALKKLPMLRDVASDQQSSSGMLSLAIDRDQAARFGIQPAAIDLALYDAFGQRQAAQFFTQANSYHVILEITPSLQADPHSLDKIYLKSPLTGQMVPLSAMTKYDTEHVSYLSISHQGQFPAITVSFNLAPGAALGDAVDAITRASAAMQLPPQITSSFQGTAQAFQSSLRSQPYLILAALVAVYIILGMLYESYIHPLTILSTLPSAGVGALLILVIFHIELSVMALIGIILLIGIVKKNGIMMVDFAIQAEREQQISPHDAIRQACLLRFRPIMMTTMAALLGALPLALGRGTGSELRQPLGYTMVGGLIVSQALTLFTTPVVYLYLDEFSLWLKGARRKRHESRAHEGPADGAAAAGEST